MPYHWDKKFDKAPATTGAFSRADGDVPLAILRIWPHRSLPRSGFVAFLVITILLLSLPLFGLLGTTALWGLLPFLALAVFSVWKAVERNYADGQLAEVLSLWQAEVELVRSAPHQPDQIWCANPYWVRVQVHETGGPVPGYLTLKGAGREVELGAFLSPEERKELARALQETLQQVPGRLG